MMVPSFVCASGGFMALFEVASTTGFVMACMLRGLLSREGDLLRLGGGREISTNPVEV